MLRQTNLDLPTDRDDQPTGVGGRHGGTLGIHVVIAEPVSLLVDAMFVPELRKVVEGCCLVVRRGSIQRGGIVHHVAVEGGRNLRFQNQLDGIAAVERPHTTPHIIAGGLLHIVDRRIVGPGKGHRSPLYVAGEGALRNRHNKRLCGVLLPNLVDVVVKVPGIGLTRAEPAVQRSDNTVGLN